MFPLSKVEEINKETHNGKWENVKVEWFLMADESHFHVYLKAVIKSLGYNIRIDWHDNSTLGFEAFLPETKKSEEIFIGKTDWFCRNCIIKCIESDMETYKLFKFNCRTVAYIILTKICRFPANQVEEEFAKTQMMCGLDERDCISMEEIRHYIAYTRRGKS